MVQGKIKINNPTGLQLRPAGLLCKKAMEYESSITYGHKEGIANAKSVLSVLGSCVQCGDEIELVCSGTDEDQAFRDISRLIGDGLGE